MSEQPELKPVSRSYLGQLVGIFIVAFAVRAVAIDVPINVDEIKWLQRGLKFIGALVDRDLAGTYLQHHPGVTSMWTNGTGAMLHCLLRDWFPSALKLDKTSLQGCAQTLQANLFPIETYVAARLIQATITSACTVYLYVLARQLLGNTTALIGTSFLLFEPFFLAYQRFLTTDAFQVDFTAIAFFLLLLYLRDGGRRRLFASGASMGLAAASKSPALTLIPAVVTVLALIELGVWRSRFPRRGFLRQGVDLGVWAMALVAAIFAIWPALWVAPLATLGKLSSDLQTETERGEFFFLGQITDAPGALFYPLVLLYRLSPLLLIGLLALAIALVVPKWQHRLRCIPELMALAIAAIFIAVILSSSDNKIDRYILPLIPFLAFLSAASWEQIWQRLGRFPNRRALALGALAAGQLLFLVPYFPYYVTYYNPLFGGAPTAERLLMMGNGEGLDRAARALNREPKAAEMTVATWYPPAFAPYFQGKTLEIGKTLDPKKPWWLKAQRVVLYLNQFQRQLPSPEVLAYYRAQPPLTTVRLNRVDYARIYPGAVALPSEVPLFPTALQLSETDSLRLRGASFSTPLLQAGGTLNVTLFWEVLSPPGATVPIVLSLRQGEREVARQEGPVLGAFNGLQGQKIAPGTFLREVRAIALPPELAPGRYAIDLNGFSIARLEAAN